ncbi:fibrinogen C domain-containing protein 1-like [Gigantopelta aegis]|uniref:fibrinogen C domain-containing protein 1-like n=1 Tax=Gigantopelta aegis TaxID=1735272 RepID=UPI001B88D56D|nr:fibrinogen C domain-containing protein 1-like [Gigantopelta aegis]
MSMLTSQFRMICADALLKPMMGSVFKFCVHSPTNHSDPKTAAQPPWMPAASVIQRRTDGSEDFYRTWNDYRDGFGDFNNEFWLGNSQIHRITSQGLYDLRIDLEDFEVHNGFALYKNFSLASEQDFFRLSLGEYSGNAGDGLGQHSGQLFSAKDKDLDSYEKQCAQMFKGAWWFRDCHSSHLNGQYLRGNHSSFGHGVNWMPWRGFYYSLKRTVMKIRPMQF